MIEGSREEPPGAGGPAFETTRWSIVLAAAGERSATGLNLREDCAAGVRAGG
jgi:hypothetical protein